MTSFLHRISPALLLRLGLGLMYVYSGIDFLVHPTAWLWAIGALPLPIKQMIATTIGTEKYLMLQGIGELVMAVVFLAWFLPKKLVGVVAALATVEMAAILLFVGLDAITFRDIGLLGAAGALFVMSLSSRDSQTLSNRM